ncbi:hypothetical protein OR1_01836 [Geobacter sp. OR-1]|uniref:hypothetical protein n=1 Tax=Geobacter sp. OR-1 TaxID=1266765 RepID=UPI000543F2CD|nr:hypothetical protein [Geobacter sp. OR-1]GAM09556.1 hypothetical protein OR1_01836 [Geobacter sp. OR-1]
MAAGSHTLREKIGLQQVLLHGSSVFSIQWIVLPRSCIGRLSPSILLDRYLQYIKVFTLSLIRPCRTNDKLEFLLLSTRFSMITFQCPTKTMSGDTESITLSICGGLLVQRENCCRGELTFSCKPIRNGIKVILQLSDYCPMLLGTRPSRLRKMLYRFTQAYIHKIVTVRFLAKIYYELEGLRPEIRVVKTRICTGEEI